ncbi:unnamed protein product, partial [Amoebophrya sp. A120]
FLRLAFCDHACPQELLYRCRAPAARHIIARRSVNIGKGKTEKSRTPGGYFCVASCHSSTFLRSFVFAASSILSLMPSFTFLGSFCLGVLHETRKCGHTRLRLTTSIFKDSSACSKPLIPSVLVGAARTMTTSYGWRTARVDVRRVVTPLCFAAASFLGTVAVFYCLLDS